MVDSFDLNMEYNFIAIQCGYLTLFACSFPLAPVIGFIVNLIDINLFIRHLTYFQKRNNGQLAERIGVWSQIFQVGILKEILTVRRWATRHCSSTL